MEGYDLKGYEKEAILRTEAARNLINANKLNVKVAPEDIVKWEKKASMTVEEKLKELAEDDSPYKEDRLQQHFSAIKSIKSVNGAILIDVDENNSKTAAVETAFKVLGPLAKEEDFKRYVAEHTHTTTMMTIKTFIRNLKTLMGMVARAPQLFGEARGGGEVKDLVKEGMEAIKEARKYLKKNSDKLPQGIAELLACQDFKTDNVKDFSKYIGDDWKQVLDDKDKMNSAAKLVGITKQ